MKVAFKTNKTSYFSKNYIPRRACMYVPANDWKKISELHFVDVVICSWLIYG